jgi:uncharacterized protein YjfI (DUF2170 family)
MKTLLIKTVLTQGKYVIITVLIFFTGYFFNNYQWERKIKNLEQKVEIVELKSEIVNTVIVKEYIDVPVEVVREKTRNLIKNVYIPIEVDRQCEIPNDVVKLHNELIIRD